MSETCTHGLEQCGICHDKAGNLWPHIAKAQGEIYGAGKAKVLHDLICDMLRGPHIKGMSKEELQEYTYGAGVALHNLPFALMGLNTITVEQMREINKLDPGAPEGDWGNWVKSLAGGFGHSLPDYN